MASLDGAGLATGLTAGTTAITASYEGVTSNTATLEVSAPTGERVAQVSVTVSPLWSFGRWWVATAMVTVTENGSPLAGATVEGTWGGRYSRTVRNTTDSFGFISFETSWLRRSGTVTFTVTGVTKDGQEYAPPRRRAPVAAYHVILAGQPPVSHKKVEWHQAGPAKGMPGRVR